MGRLSGLSLGVVAPSGIVSLKDLISDDTCILTLQHLGDVTTLTIRNHVEKW